MQSDKLDSLNHVVRDLSNGGSVLVLDTGAVIGPEEEAMLQALHSRSIGGIREHLKKLGEVGAENFMSTFYVGYNHKSIGDCGSGTIFIEGVSMLAAKAIQDWKLYSGQESSTRYIDFSSQLFLNPTNMSAGEEILENSRSFYLHGLETLVPALAERFPRQEGEKKNVYEKAIKARAFDIMRSFLPAGATTNLAWHSNLRQIADKLIILRHHPLQEVREIADAIQDAVSEKYPNSFGHKVYEATESYNNAWMSSHYSYEVTGDHLDFLILRNGVDTSLLSEEYGKILRERPQKTDLPKYLDEVGDVQFGFFLDFGSFRDIQRHRAVTQRMPLVTTDHGFGKWYLKELTDELRNEALEFLDHQKTEIEGFALSEQEKQYYIPMGYELPNRLTGTLPALVYLAELRATRFVHPTVRRRAVQIAQSLEALFGEYGLVLHLDDDPDRFDVRRGQQDIVEKSMI